MQSRQRPRAPSAQPAVEPGEVERGRRGEAEAAPRRRRELPVEVQLVHGEEAADLSRVAVRPPDELVEVAGGDGAAQAQVLVLLQLANAVADVVSHFVRELFRPSRSYHSFSFEALRLVTRVLMALGTTLFGSGDVTPIMVIFWRGSV